MPLPKFEPSIEAGLEEPYDPVALMERLVEINDGLTAARTRLEVVRASRHPLRQVLDRQLARARKMIGPNSN